MRAAPCVAQGQGVSPFVQAKADAEAFFWVAGAGAGEPTSVLDRLRSPSPPNSTSTLSSSLGAGGVAAKWATVALSGDDVAPATVAALAPPVDAGDHEQTFLHWIMTEDAALKPPLSLPAAAAPPPPQFLDDNAAFDFGFVDPGFFSPESLSLPFPPAIPFHEAGGKVPEAQVLPPPPPQSQPFPPAAASLLQQPHAAANTAAFFMPLPSFGVHHHISPQPTLPLASQLPPPPQFLQPPSKRHNHGGGVPFPSPSPHGGELFPFVPLSKLRPIVGGEQQLLDQLFEAARLFESGELIGAREILARLNHGLLPVGKPPVRSAFYLKEALLLATNIASGNAQANARISPTSSPLDVALKLGAYKTFSEVSPITQFASFTTTQAMLDELGNAHRIHILDFDIGVGGQWSSFLQEIAHRCTGGNGSVMPLVRVTAFVSSSSHDPLELHLTQENLCQFAADLGISFEFNARTLDMLDPGDFLIGDEVIAVAIPVGFGSNSVAVPFPVILRLLRQLQPKVVVVVDHGGDRGDLSFSQHFMQLFQSTTFLLDSIDSAGAIQEAASKIEHFLIQPRIESAVLERSRCPANEKMPPWRTLLTSAGFLPVQLSNFAEAQADCLMKRIQVRGFQVEKRQASLTLYWQRGELVSVSAWKC